MGQRPPVMILAVEGRETAKSSRSLPVRLLNSASHECEHYLHDNKASGDKEEPRAIDVELGARWWFEQEAFGKTEGSE